MNKPDEPGTKSTMKKHYHYTTIFILLLAATLLPACKKFLETESANRLSADEIFQDFEGARTALVGCYDNLRSTDYYLKNFTLYPELTGGNAKFSRGTSLDLFTTYNFANSPLASSDYNDMFGFYKLAYNIIYRCNNIFTNISSVKDATTFQIARMRADAYTIRAMVHFDLVRVFAQPYNYTPDAMHTGIVIRPQNTGTTLPVEAPATVKAVYDFITSDLDSAIALYSQSVGIYAGGADKTWLSGDAAKAIAARVALYRGDWAKVISLTTDVLAANKYPLISNAQYINSWNKQVISTESIFELAQGNRVGGAIGDYLNNSNTISGYFAATNDLLNLFAPGDIRGRDTFFVRKNIAGANYYFTKKYQGTADSANNIKIIRASELYLSRAEAAAESGNLASALTDLNLIRKRANPAAVNLTIINQQQLVDSVLAERRRELCFEAHSLWDISRKKKNLVRTDCSSSNCSFSYPNDKFACPRPVVQ